MTHAITAIPLYGERLDREQALKHPWLGEFWEVVDLVLLSDPTVRPYLQPGASA